MSVFLYVLECVVMCAVFGAFVFGLLLVDMGHMMLENCGAAIKWFIKAEKQFPEECARERIVMCKECIQWIEQVWE